MTSKTAPTGLPALLANEKIQLAICVVGVVGSLLVYGVLQERTVTIPFGEGDAAEVFKYSLFLVLCNRIVAVTISATSLLLHGKYSELKPVAPLWSYMCVSASNVLSTTCQYEALKHVSFAVQTLGKCAKMFPVMIWGFIIMKRRYSLREVLLAVAITGGCFVFFITGPTASRLAKDKAESTLMGVLLIIGYLAADGFTSTLQEKMFKGYQMTPSNQVFYNSLCSIVLSSAGLVTSGQLNSALAFLSRHPDATASIFFLSCAASTGTMFISYTIKTFGALVFAIIMTTRQFLSILLSSLWFRNPLTFGQWVGTCIVVGALYYQSASKRSGAASAAARGGTGGGARSRPPSLNGSKPVPAATAAGPGSDEESGDAAPLLGDKPVVAKA